MLPPPPTPPKRHPKQQQQLQVGDLINNATILRTAVLGVRYKIILHPLQKKALISDFTPNSTAQQGGNTLGRVCMKYTCTDRPFFSTFKYTCTDRPFVSTFKYTCTDGPFFSTFKYTCVDRPFFSTLTSVRNGPCRANVYPGRTARAPSGIFLGRGSFRAALLWG